MYFAMLCCPLANPMCCRLGEVIASSNTIREEELSTLRRPGDAGLSPPSSPSRHMSRTALQRMDTGHTSTVDCTSMKKAHPSENITNNANIESLIEKMRSGLEVMLCLSLD